MNVVFLSPAFPPGSHLFCTALAARGVRVLGIGDEPAHALPPELAAALTEYVFAPEMADDRVLHAAVAGLVARHGAIDRLESNGEHWLDAEGRLRDAFDVPGLRTEEVRLFRSKRGMAERFASAGVETPPSAACDSPAAVRGLAQRHGFPLVFKPDTGSGAADTFAVHDQDALSRALCVPRPHHIVQPFVEGEIVTFDGLVDDGGEIVMSTSHAYDMGIMEVRQAALDGHYYSLRVIPAAIEEQGRRAVAAFGLRQRFFHVEFFVRPDGSLVALEMNVRPPGGFTTDMMNYAGDIDVYALWAAVIAGDSPGAVEYERRFHVAHAGRRQARSYRHPHDALLPMLGATLLETRAVPPAFAATMGDVAYLLRHPDLDAVRAAIADVQAPA
ncbi:MAG: ATP-grasp domain-containing protein [Polyangiaceae bacterium]